ncbi:MAG: hypothetical protein KDK23_01885 [Leptospiraceae bacterium]|nr:hypothetical protein [Leptospiraceae bacterium]
MKPLRYLTLLALIAQLGLSCATLDVERLPQDSERKQLEPLELRAGIEPYFRRVDIIRQQDCTTTTTVNADGTVSTRTQCTPRPYYPLGVYMGNGLFLDAVGNLSVDLVTYIGLDDQNDFTISQTYESILGDSTHTMVRSGDTLTVTIPGLFSDSTIVYKFTRNGVLLDDGSRLVTDANGARHEGIEKTTFLGIDFTANPPSVKRVSEHSYEVGPFLVTRNSDGSLTLGKEFRIVNEGTSISMHNPGGFLISDETILLFEGPGKLAVVDSENIDHGFLVEWNGEILKITEGRGNLGFESEETIKVIKGN